MSKHFKPEEIIGYLTIDGRKVTYLKQGVKRNPRYQDHLIEDMMDHLNHSIIWIKRWEEYYRKVVGIDDFEVK